MYRQKVRNYQSSDYILLEISLPFLKLLKIHQGNHKILGSTSFRL